MRTATLAALAALSCTVSALAQCQPAAAATYGAGTPTTYAGNPRPSLQTETFLFPGVPRIGTTEAVSLGLTGVNRAFSCVIVAAIAPASIPFFHGTLLVEPSAIIWTKSGSFHPTNPFPPVGVRFLWMFNIPNSTAMCVPWPLVFQGIVVDSTAPHGFWLSNGVEWRIGT